MHLQIRLEELRSARFASPKAPLFLIDVLARLNNYIQERLAEICDETTKFPSINYDQYEAISRKVGGFAEALSTLYAFLTLVENSRIDIVPPGVVTSIQRIARELGLKYPIILCPTHENTYAYDNILLAGGSNSLRSETLEHFFPKELFRDFFDHLPVLRFPFVIRDDILCHSLLYHELAHFISEVNTDFDRCLSGLDLSKPLKLNYAGLQRIFREYLSDTIAVCLVGPAFLFAIVEFITSIIGFYEATQDHPPLILRVRNILDTMKKYEQWDFFENNSEKKPFMDAAKDLFEEFDRIADLNDSNIDEESRAIFEALKSHLEEARHLVRQYVPRSIQFIPDAQLTKAVEDFIINGIPPSADIETGKPLPLATILNTGWIYRMAFLQKPLTLSHPFEKSKRASDLMDLSRLIHTAISQSETIQQYREYDR